MSEDLYGQLSERHDRKHGYRSVNSLYRKTYNPCRVKPIYYNNKFSTSDDCVQPIRLDSTVPSGCAETGTEARDRYKNVLTAALRTCGTEASEEIPKGFGKCDIFIPGTGTDPAIAVEIKTSSETVPEVSADKAYEQIVDKGCASEPLDGKTAWIALGIRGKWYRQ